MNERIKELAEQAGLTDYMVFGRIESKEDVLKNFTELVVRECAAQVDWILAEGGKTQGDLIREHFGVKE